MGEWNRQLEEHMTNHFRLIVFLLIITVSAGCQSGQPPRDSSDQGKIEVHYRCGGQTLYPESFSSGEIIATADLKYEVYSQWKKQFMEKNSLTEELFRQRIRISGISLSEGPSFVYWRIDYVFVFDWIRTRQNSAVRLGEYPLKTTPTQEEIARLVRLELGRTRPFDTPAVVSSDTAVKAFARCASNMNIDWCHIEFNSDGRLFVTGRSVINLNANECKEAAIDLTTGKVSFCRDVACWED